jgi:hypothetical protein
MLFFSTCALFITACTPITGWTHPITSFELHSSAGPLPPEYQRATTIRGTIEPTRITLVYRFSDKDGEIERPLTIEGDLYQKYITMVQQTRIKVIPLAQRPIGGSIFDVTLTDEQGQSTMGPPSNRQAWAEFAQEIAQKVGAPIELR